MAERAWRRECNGVGGIGEASTGVSLCLHIYLDLFVELV